MNKVFVPTKYARLVYGLVNRNGERRCELDGPYKNTASTWERVLLTPDSDLDKLNVYHAAYEKGIDKYGIDVLDKDGNLKEKVFSWRVRVNGVKRFNTTENGFEIEFDDNCKCEVVKRYSLPGQQIRIGARELKSNVCDVFASWMNMQDTVISVNNRKTRLMHEKSEALKRGIDLTPDFHNGSNFNKRK